MARYIDDPDRQEPTVGHSADPNYDDGGYWGMRMRRSPGLAAYGWYRRDWSDDLETAGGFGGIHGPIEYRGGPRGEASWEEGGVVEADRDLRVIRDFNARSPMYEGDATTGNHLVLSDETGSVRPWEVRGLYSGEYTDRGLTDAGFSEGWARGPVPGAR